MIHLRKHYYLHVPDTADNGSPWYTPGKKRESLMDFMLRTWMKIESNIEEQDAVSTTVISCSPSIQERTSGNSVDINESLRDDGRLALTSHICTRAERWSRKGRSMEDMRCSPWFNACADCRLVTMGGSGLNGRATASLTPLL